MNTVGSTTVDIKKTLLHYIKAEFKEKNLDMLKSLLGSIYAELTNTPDILPMLFLPRKITINSWKKAVALKKERLTL